MGNRDRIRQNRGVQGQDANHGYASKMPCFYYSLVLYNEWIIIVRAILFDGTESRSVITMLPFKMQLELHLLREPKLYI